MTLAPVIDYATARRRHLARRLQTLGVPLEAITATTSDTELDQLWQHTQHCHALAKLTGYPPTFFGCWNLDDLGELHRACLRHLMDPNPRWEQHMTASLTGRHQRPA